MEILEEYLTGHIGVKGVPLSYVVRSKKAVAPNLDEPETSFLSAEDKMVARTPMIEGGMSTVTFKTDMMKVWGMISVIMRDLYFWTYFKSAHKTRDGSKSYLDLWYNLLRPDNLDNMVSYSESLLFVTH